MTLSHDVYVDQALPELAHTTAGNLLDVMQPNEGIPLGESRRYKMEAPVGSVLPLPIIEVLGQHLDHELRMRSEQHDVDTTKARARLANSIDTWQQVNGMVDKLALEWQQAPGFIGRRLTSFLCAPMLGYVETDLIRLQLHVTGGPDDKVNSIAVAAGAVRSTRHVRIFSDFTMASLEQPMPDTQDRQQTTGQLLGLTSGIFAAVLKGRQRRIL
jgi:hypothetical protein